MYVPRLFRAPSSEAVVDYIRRNSFATLISVNQAQRPIATHIPLLIQEAGDGHILSGHLSIANEQRAQLEDGHELLAIFMQQHAYISSSWYDHVNVPTWNYIAVHVYGTVRMLTGDELYQSISDMVDTYEDGREGRFHLRDFSEKELKAHLNGVVGFEMSMDDIQAAFKLSQNRKDHNYQEIIRQLASSEDSLERLIAEQMKEMRP